MSGIIEDLKSNLQPKGSMNVVRIGFHDATGGSAYFEKDFIDNCVSEMSALLSSSRSRKPTHLEQLAMQLLVSSARMSRTISGDHKN